jgi:hypothetical protein
VDEGVEDHRAAAVEVDFEAVDPRVLAVIRVPAIDPKPARAFDRLVERVGVALADLGIRGQGKLGHGVGSPVSVGLAESKIRRKAGESKRNHFTV